MSYSIEELEKIAELRRRVKDELATEEQHENHFLIRWLRARSMNLDKAEEMLRKSLKWRKQYGADTILQTEDIPELYRKKYMFGVFGEDKEGHPILVLPAGRHDHKFLIESVGMETAIKWNVVLMENVMQILREHRAKTNKPIYTYHEIIDMEGYSYRSLMYKPGIDFVAQVQRIFDENYPDILQSASVINAPKIFSLLFGILKPLIPKETLEKVTIYGSNKEEWLEAFRKRGFPLENFPPNWGGSREGSDEFCSQEPVWVDYPVPLKYFKEVPEADEEGFFTVKVGARDRLELKFPSLNNNGSTTVDWKFKTDGRDISFQLSFTDHDNSNEEVVIPLKRVDSHKQLQRGSKTFDVRGTFTFLFDNRYSFTKSKTLKYQINVS